MADPMEWIKPELVEKHAPGFIFGSVATFYFIIRFVKSGFLVFGDKAKLAAEAAVLEAKVKHLEAEIKEKDAEIAKLKGFAA